jgi:hypothetical protein
LTRGERSRSDPEAFRVSIDCWNSGIRVSCHSRLPNSNGELTETARSGAVTA